MTRLATAYHRPDFYAEPIRKPENSSGIAILALFLTLGIVAGLLLIGGLLGRHFYPIEYSRFTPVHVASTETKTHNQYIYRTQYQKVRVTATDTVTVHGKLHPDPTVTVTQLVTPSPLPA